MRNIVNKLERVLENVISVMYQLVYRSDKTHGTIQNIS